MADEKVAALLRKGHDAGIEELKTLSEVQLREYYSRMTGKKVNRFASKQEGLGRITRFRRKLLDKAQS